MKKILLTILCLMGISLIHAEEYSYTFTAKQFSANGTKTLDGIDWTITGDGGYWGFDNSKGQQFGSGNNPYTTLTMSTSSFAGNIISKITINTSGASSTNAKMSVSVGGTSFGTSDITLTKTATDYEFTGSASGDIVFTWTQTSKKAIYVKSITITYEPTGVEVVSKPTFSINEGVVYGEKVLEISSETEGATISYSIDGGEYVAGNTVTIDKTMSITAKAEKDGCEPTTSQTSYVFADCVYEKMNVNNIEPGTYVIASYFNDIFYLMKNEIVSNYYPGGTESNLSENAQIDAANLFIITGDETNGYQIQNNGGYVTLLSNGSYTNVKIDQAESTGAWSFTEMSNGAIKASYGDVEKFLSFATTYKNFSTDTEESACPVFYRINDNVLTGIEDAMIDADAPVEYYNLQGVKVANPENGIFIKRQGGKAIKVVL